LTWLCAGSAQVIPLVLQQPRQTAGPGLGAQARRMNMEGTKVKANAAKTADSEMDTAEPGGRLRGRAWQCTLPSLPMGRPEAEMSSTSRYRTSSSACGAGGGLLAGSIKAPIKT
jgi:hypothetical protein